MYVTWMILPRYGFSPMRNGLCFRMSALYRETTYSRENWRSRSKEAMVVEGLLWPEFKKKRIPDHLIVSSLFLRLLTPIQYPKKMDEKPSGEFINTYLTFNKRYDFNEGDC